MSKTNYMRNFIIASLTRLNATLQMDFGFKHIQADDPEDDADTAVKFGIITSVGNYVITIAWQDSDSTFTMFIHNCLYTNSQAVKDELLVTSINWQSIADACNSIPSLLDSLKESVPEQIKNALMQAGIMQSNLRPINMVEEDISFEFQSATRRIIIRIVYVGGGWALTLSTPEAGVFYRTFSEKLTVLMDHLKWYFGDIDSPMHFTD